MSSFAHLNEQIRQNCHKFRNIVDDEFSKASSLISEYVNSFRDPVWIYYVWYIGKGVNLQTSSIIQLELPPEAKLEYKLEKLLKWDLKPEQDVMIIQVLNKDIDFDERYCICKASDLIKLEKNGDIKFIEIVDETLLNNLVISEQNPELAKKIQSLKNRELANHLIQQLVNGQADIVKMILASLKDDAFNESALELDDDINDVLEDISD